MASDAELIAGVHPRPHRAPRAHTAERAAGQPLSLAEAYRLQDVLRETLLRRGEKVTGWKAGFTESCGAGRVPGERARVRVSPGLQRVAVGRGGSHLLVHGARRRGGGGLRGCDAT